jgi:hypothetical protein
METLVAGPLLKGPASESGAPLPRRTGSVTGSVFVEGDPRGRAQRYTYSSGAPVID